MSGGTCSGTNTSFSRKILIHFLNTWGMSSIALLRFIAKSKSSKWNLINTRLHWKGRSKKFSTCMILRNGIYQLKIWNPYQNSISTINLRLWKSCSPRKMQIYKKWELTFSFTLINCMKTGSLTFKKITKGIVKTLNSSQSRSR